MIEEFDLVIIGGGPGGYVAAIRAAQLGLKTACIEKRTRLGGTCLNVGCIPSKALLHSSALYKSAHEDFAQHGIQTGNTTIDLKQMLGRKAKVIEDLGKGIDMLFAKNKVTKITGHAAFISSNEIEVQGEKTLRIKFKHSIIATGSEVASLPGILIDEKRIISSTGALELTEVPKHLVVIGGGYIGLEMGSVWSRLGSKVTVVEFMDKIVPAMDSEIGRTFQKTLEKQGFEFKLSTKVLSAKTEKNNVMLELENVVDHKKENLSADVVLVAVGRKPYTENLGLATIGIKLDAKGRVPVNHNFQTNIPSIYAIGDVIEGPMLAHKAEEEGVAAVEIIAGQAGHVNYKAIPGVVYTDPEVATVGLTEEEAQNAKIDYVVGKFPFMANSRARATGHTDGFVKIIARKNDDEVLGVHIIGPEAGSLIAQCVLAMEYRASSEDIARTCHAHPTLNEAIKEAALDVLKRAIHK
jgi:dihydrolipoamide dehydrogenase